MRVKDGNAASVTVAAGSTQRNAIAPIGPEPPIFCGRRLRFWIVGVPAGCVVEKVAVIDVATLPAGIVVVFP